MTASLTAPGKTPANDVEVIGQMLGRIRALETAPTTRVGSWVIADDGGVLKAFKPGTSMILGGDGAELPDLTEALAGYARLSDLEGLASQAELPDLITQLLGADGSPLTALLKALGLGLGGTGLSFTPEAIQALLGHIPMDNIEGLAEALAEAAINAGIDFANLGLKLFGLPGLDADQFAAVAHRFFSLFGNPDLSGPLNPLDLADIGKSFIQNAISPWIGSDPTSLLLGPRSPLDAAQLFNAINPALIPLVNVASVGDASPNYLENGGFDTRESVVDQGNQGWFWRGTSGHGNLGCAVIAPVAGRWETLESNIVPVAVNQVIPVGIWVHHIGTTSAAGTNGVMLNVRAYKRNAAGNPEIVSTTTVASIATPNGTSVNPGHAGYIELAGSFPVPAGVDYIALQLAIAPTVYGGEVEWDDGVISKTGLLPQNLVNGLPTDLANLANQAQAIIDNSVQALLGIAGTGFLPADLKTALTSFPKLNNLYDTLAGTPGGGLTQIAQRLLGLDTTGKLDASWLKNLGGIPTIPNLLTKAPDLAAHVDDVANALSGNTVTGTEVVGNLLPDAKTVMANLYEQVTGLTRRVQGLETEAQAAAIGGKRFNIDFSDYPNGPIPTSLFPLQNYSGPGGSTVAVKDGNAIWNLVNNGNRSWLGRYVDPTATDFQVVRGTMASAPEQGSNVRIWATARMNATGTDYVWARGYCTGWLSYKGDIGCTINGVETVWRSGVSLTWSLDMYLVAGVGNNARRYQVISGTTPVVDIINGQGGFVDNSLLDSNHRYWGSRADTNGQQTPGAIAGASVRDNAQPAVVGTTFRASRRVTSDVTIASGGAHVPNNFYETVDYISDDLSYNPADSCAVTVTDGGTYRCTHRAYHGLYGSGSGGMAMVTRNGVIQSRGPWADTQFSAGFAVIVSKQDATYGSFDVLCQAGDVLRPAFDFTSSMGDTGDAKLVDGSQSYWEVVKVG
ncbi:MAG: hypothetical protein JO214_00700 [Frankiaceae bacterium]|nr:hypothetical protein [Frankiaceae bacterium]